MKVIHISYSDGSGGAARAAYRLHLSLLRSGIDSTMQVWSKASGDRLVMARSSKIDRMVTEARSGIELLIARTMKTNNRVLHSLNLLPSGWVKSLNSSIADIIHLHWIGGETMSIREIGQICKPVVWTFHDMWAFCGTEHYADDGSNARWRQGYRANNRPQDESGIDLDNWTARRKQRYWKKPFELVCPSNWLAECVKSSALMSSWPVSVIPNPLDLDSFKPIEKQLSRQLLNLPQERELILFGAMGGGEDPRKGNDLLIAALACLRKRKDRNIELVIFGQLPPLTELKLGFPIRYMGHIHDDISLALLYSAVDVFVAPSRQDNLPNTVVEAMACGTPAVAFRIGGMPDLISHQVSGYLARPNDIEDLAFGIEWVLDKQAQTNQLGVVARQSAEANYHPHLVAQKYNDVYRAAIERSSQNFH